MTFHYFLRDFDFMSVVFFAGEPPCISCHNVSRLFVFKFLSSVSYVCLFFAFLHFCYHLFEKVFVYHPFLCCLLFTFVFFLLLLLFSLFILLNLFPWFFFLGRLCVPKPWVISSSVFCWPFSSARLSGDKRVPYYYKFIRDIS